MNLANRFSTASLMGALLLTQLSSAYAQSPVAQTTGRIEKASVERQATERVTQLFDRLCPGRCEVIEVKAEVGTTRVTQAIPGFDTPENEAYAAKPRRLAVTVLLDKKLPNGFRQNMARMLRYRLKDLSKNVAVRTESLDFPEPQTVPLADAETPAAPVPETPAEPAPVSRFDELLKNLYPWVGPLLFLALLLGGAGWLLTRTRPASPALDAPPSDEAGSDPSNAHPALETLGEISSDALRAQLFASRRLKNVVLKTWLQDDPQGVANIVRLFGVDMMDDLQKSGERPSELRELAKELKTRPGPLNPAQEKSVLFELRARLDAAGLLETADSLDHHWDFIEAVPPHQLRPLFEDCSPGERAELMQRLPSETRARFVAASTDAERRHLLLMGDAHTLGRSESVALAHRLRAVAHEQHQKSEPEREQARLILDMLNPLENAAQLDLLRELQAHRPQVATHVLSSVVLEPTLQSLPADVLANAIHRVPLQNQARFLDDLPEAVRNHILNVFPETLRTRIERELGRESMRPEERAEVRSDVYALLRESAELAGVDLLTLNQQHLTPPRASKEKVSA